MNDVILISIKPDYSQAILAGIKKVEYRKRGFSRPVKKMIIYETSPIQKVVGEVLVLGILQDSVDRIWKMTCDVGEVSKDDFYRYYGNRKKAYAIQLGEIRIYGKPLNLKDFGISRAPQSFCYL